MKFVESKIGRRCGVLCFALAAILAGCGGGTSSNSSSSSQPSISQTSAISIAFQPAPVKSVSTGDDQETFTAVVSNDPSNAGVDWCLAYAGQACGASCPSCTGSLNLVHAQSGQPVTFTPPTNFSGNSLSVDIVAFATADHTKNVVAPVTVVGFLGNLIGKYVFQAAGGRINPTTQSSTEQPYRITGIVNLDGKGGVELVNVNGRMVGGEQTIVGPAGFGSANITGGSYTLGPDGRGLLTVNTDDPTVGLKGAETFSMVFLSSSQLLIAQIDGTTSAAGDMDLQTDTTVPTGGYAFAVSGTGSGGGGVALGGILNVDQANGAISGNGSVADRQFAGTLRTCHGPGGPGNSGISGAFAAADTFGAVRLSLSTCFSSNPLQFTGYLVDQGHIKLIETDLTPSAGMGFATSGIALGQGIATGTFAGAQSFTGSYVFGITGFDHSGLTSSLTSAGTLASTGTGTLSGNSDELTTTGIMISDGFSGGYSADSSGTGRIDVPFTFNNNASLSTPELIFYLSGNGGPALVLDSDVVAPAVGVGIAFPQAAPPVSFNGKYGFDWSNLSQPTPGAMWMTSDTSGNMTVDPSSDMMNGLVDGPGLSGQTALQLAVPLTGTVAGLPTIGSFNGSLTAVGTGLGTNTVMVDYYLADSKHGFVIETDLNASLLLGYFAARNPVCPTCP